MNGYGIAFVVLIAIEALLTIATIGRPRKPRTPGEAVAQVIEWGIVLTLGLLSR